MSGAEVLATVCGPGFGLVGRDEAVGKVGCAVVSRLVRDGEVELSAGSKVEGVPFARQRKELDLEADQLGPLDRDRHAANLRATLGCGPVDFDALAIVDGDETNRGEVCEPMFHLTDGLARVLMLPLGLPESREVVTKLLEFVRGIS